jgi:hypothetical protein
MDDDFDNDMDLADDNLADPLGDLGDLGEGEVTLEVEAEYDDTSELGGSRSSGGARALTTTRAPDSARKAAKAAPKKAAPKAAKKKPAPKKAAKKAAPKKAAKKKAAPKKKSKPAKRKAGSKK